jgi:Tol biopolymer transport system component
MGEVYRARDARLERDVAIKVLPASFSADADRLARFQQEARATAALNHPNILAVFDFGEHDAAPFIVTELLEGSTLRERLASGALAERKAAEYAIQIAQGLAAAHDRGIVHRDLKPENVFVTSDGLVKILDFGLAKLTQPAGVAGGTTTLPTSPALTGPGMVLGTIGYLAPEQIRGLQSDHRADIFAFGAVLYEMVSGSRAFAGATAADTMTAILTKDPPELMTSAVSVSATLDRVIRHCVEKVPEERFQSARDLIFALKNASTPSHASGVMATSAASSRKMHWPVVAAAATATVAIAVAALWLMTWQAPTGALAVQRFEVSAADFRRSDYADFALSPDGHYLALAENPRSKDRRLWLRALDSREVRPIPGTERGEQPFWSPDNRAIGFSEGDAIYRVDLPGSPRRRVTEAKGGTLGAAWHDGWIYFASATDRVIYRVPDSGGAPVQITTLAPNQSAHAWPRVLSGGRQMLFYSSNRSRAESGNWVQDLSSGTKTFLGCVGGGGAIANGFFICKSADGLTAGGVVTAQPFDKRTLQLTGSAITIATSTTSAVTRFVGGFSASENGLLAVALPAPTRHQLRWFSRAGVAQATVGDISRSPEFSLEPGRNRIVTMKDGSALQGSADLWLLADGGSPVRLTYDGAMTPRWITPGTVIFAQRARVEVETMMVRVDSGQPPAPFGVTMERNYRVQDVSVDGRLILFKNLLAPLSLWIAPASPPTAPRPIVSDRFPTVQGVFSPDGRWLAVTQNLPEGSEVFVQAVTGSQRVRVSSRGGIGPVWRADGRELFYESLDGHVMAVPVEQSSGEFRPGRPVELFSIRTQGLVTNQPNNFQVSGDGQRFLVNTVVDDSDNAPLEIIVNWPALLKKNH